MMTDTIMWAAACLGAGIFISIIWLVSHIIFGAYFEAKEKFVERIVLKQKESTNGEDR